MPLAFFLAFFFFLNLLSKLKGKSQESLGNYDWAKSYQILKWLKICEYIGLNFSIKDKVKLNWWFRRTALPQPKSYKVTNT